MRRLPHAHNSHGDFQKTSDQGGRPAKSAKSRRAFFRNARVAAKSCMKSSSRKINGFVRGAIITFAQSAKERIENLLDPGSFRGNGRRSADRSTRCVFREWPRTRIGSRNIRRAPGLIDAVISGHGMIDGYKVAHCGDGFQFSRSHDGIGRWRTNHARDRIRHGRALARSSSFPLPAARACMKEC